MQPPVVRTSSPQSPTVSGPYWSALRVVAVILKILAWLVLLGGIAFSVSAVLGILNQTMTNFLPVSAYSLLPIAIGAVLIGILNFIIFYAFADLILLLIAIERNTRNRY